MVILKVKCVAHCVVQWVLGSADGSILLIVVETEGFLVRF